MLFEKQADFWIGLNDRGREGWYWWTDNSPVKYTNWDANQPGHSNLLFDCIHMTYSRNHEGRWITAQCEQRLGYICETRALPLGPTSAAPPSNGTCPLHYQLFGDDCYFVSYVKLSWQEAREACRAESNGDLISVHTPLEQAFVIRSLKNFNSGLWLGFVREANSAAFSWTDHSLPMFSTWAAREPNRLSTQKSCVVAKNSNAGLWSDEDCSQRNGFICRIRRGEPHVSPPVLGNCPAGWEKFDKNCYQFRRDRRSWTAARATCQRQGGNLVSITSRQEQDYIAYHYRHQYYGNIWTGLNDRALEAGYTWSDGSPVSFLNWFPGEPNDDSFIENCVEMSAGSLQWKDNICTEFNSYICKQPLECAGALGMVSGGIKGTQVTASSSVSPLHSPGVARLNSSTAWCAGNDSADQFIQVDFLTETRLSKISTQGFNLNGGNSYVSLFKLQTSEDGVNFQTYRKNGKDWTFIANRDSNSVVTSAVEPSIDTRLIRLVPVSWKGSICMRLEFYGCPFACETPLGMQSGVVKDDSVSASSSSDNQHRATNARPSSSVGWCAKASDTRPWLQVSFPNLYTKITKITTWGGGKGSGFVTVYRLMFTDVADVNTWADYKEGGKIRNFRGNQDVVNPMTHLLAEPITTRNLRVKPQSWSPGGACLRLELFGCEENVQPTPFPSISPSGSGPPLKDVVYSGSVRLSKEEWRDDYKDSKSAAFQLLAAKVESSITEVYSGEDKASLAFLNVKVTSFRRGSVVVLFNLRFIGDIANELGANVTSSLVNAVRTGVLGELTVDPNSLNITKSDTDDQGTAAARTGDESGGLSNGAKAGIAVAVLILVTIVGGTGAWWFYKKRKGKPLFNHQPFNNPVYFSSEKQEVKSDNGAISSKPTLKFQE